jgi:1-piperideine-2-carboxylate/1-pyrroline-2-carboxylate reductase [NAD(P)H]
MFGGPKGSKLGNSHYGRVNMESRKVKQPMEILDAGRTAAALPYTALVAALARVAHELNNGLLCVPERQVVEVDATSTLLCMPAIGHDLGITKIVTVHRGNDAYALPTIQGEVIVFDAKSGQRLVLLDGPTVTARRTAAITLLAIDTLVPNRPRSALLIGTGVQAREHVQALLEYMDIRLFWIAGRTYRRAAEFAQTLSTTGSSFTPIAIADIPPEGLGSDVVIALTTAQWPVIPVKLAPETLAIGVGAFRPDMAELPPDLLRLRRVVVDNLQGAKREAGDLIQAALDWSQVSDLAQMLDGACSREHLPTAFKSVGHASWDLAAARVAVRHLEESHENTR